ncbi:hypothetical protein ON010_g18341 [Phytophthora cinnamomi]|nr:hypothetical protein ON010_g18341 [Phytophthora cinnamomi]
MEAPSEPPPEPPAVDSPLRPLSDSPPADSALQHTEESAIASLVDEQLKVSVSAKLHGRKKFLGGHSMDGGRRRRTLLRSEAARRRFHDHNFGMGINRGQHSHESVQQGAQHQL